MRACRCALTAHLEVYTGPNHTFPPQDWPVAGRDPTLLCFLHPIGQHCPFPSIHHCCSAPQGGVSALLSAASIDVCFSKCSTICCPWGGRCTCPEGATPASPILAETAQGCFVQSPWVGSCQFFPPFFHFLKRIQITFLLSEWNKSNMSHSQEMQGGINQHQQPSCSPPASQRGAGKEGQAPASPFPRMVPRLEHPGYSHITPSEEAAGLFPLLGAGGCWIPQPLFIHWPSCESGGMRSPAAQWSGCVPWVVAAGT